MLCEQTGLVALYFVARQLIVGREERRAILAGMFALAVALSCYGLYQYFISLPATRAHYLADPDAALRQIGQWFPPGSKERYAFEQRLASVEPMATFALTNSLAGFLTAWLVAAVGCLVLTVEPVSRRARICAALGVTVGAACLLLTKSRSGYIGAAVGVGLIVVTLPALQRLRNTKALLAGAGVLTLLIGALAWQGGLDRLVLSEAPKSLGYRWEYWQAALAMTGDHPLLGCGPGNFADTYTKYKLPASSEEISDPHNFLLEIASVAGWPALAIFVAWMIALLRRSRAVDPEARPTAAVASGNKFPWSVALGAAAGFGLAQLVAPLLGVDAEPLLAFCGIAIVSAVLFLLHDWVLLRDSATAENSRGPAAEPIMPAMVALLINLSAAGGLGFPSVASSLWLLAALLVNARQPAPDAEFAASRQTVARSKHFAWTAAVGALMAAGLAIVFAYRPVLTSQTLMFQADHHPGSAGSRLLAATEADPWSDEAWRRLAAVRYADWLESQQQADFDGFEQALRAAIRLRPRSSGLHLEAGDRYLDAFHRRQDADLLERAIDHYRQVIALYPHDAPRQARLAVALRTAGKTEEAAAVATEALRLSDLSPHVEHQLWLEPRAQVEAIAAGKP